MNQELSRHIAEAAGLATSGRWDRVNTRIKELCARLGTGNEWWVQLFASLCFQIFSEYQAIKRAYENPQKDDVPLLAWRARNLLELSVWSMYCAKDRGNARRVYEDAGRDVIGVYDAFMKWGTTTNQTADWLDPLAAAKQDVSERGRLRDGITSLDGPYKQVSVAATECGIGDHFAVTYKILSKFAHPTAMRILSPPDPEREGLQRDWFFCEGCLYFVGAFTFLEGQLLATEPVAYPDRGES